MLKNRKWLAMFVSMALVVTFIFSTTMIFAEDDVEEEEITEETVEETDLKDVTTDDAIIDKITDLGGYKGLVAHWKFDGDLKDSTQYKNDGEAIGGKRVLPM
jgi:hypothetical protein